MYVPSNWTHKRTRPVTDGGMFYFTAEQHACGFKTTERLPGTNAAMNATDHEQEQHEAGDCAA